MKGHWLKVIRVWTLGFLAGVMADTGSSLISYSGMQQCSSREQNHKRRNGMTHQQSESVRCYILKTISMIYLNWVIGDCSESSDSDQLMRA